MGHQKGLTLRSLLLGVALLFLSGLWVRQAGLVLKTANVAESVPPIPAISVAFLLGALLPTARRRLPRPLRLTPAEVAVIYTFVAVGISMSSVGVVRFLFPLLVVPFYFATPENGFEAINRLIPTWWVPHDEEVLRQLYEGAPTESVPWGAWAGPLLLWAALFLSLWLAFLGLNVLLRRQWTERERLTYPIVRLVSEALSLRAGRPLLSDAVFWLGFLLSFAYNVPNMAAAFNPAIPHVGRYFDLGALLNERPWTALRPLVIHFRPAIFGIGYFMSLEALLSVWVFFLLLRFESLVAAAAGLELPGFPFPQQQSQGAFLALAFLLLWTGRAHLKAAVKRALGLKGGAEDAEEPLSYRLALLLLLGGLGFAAAWCWLSGMWLWVAALYLGLVLATSLVYCRIRAETGAPMIWLFPFWEQKRLIVNLFGTRALARGGDLRNLTALSGMVWLSRGYFLALPAYQLEGFKLADEVGMSRRGMAAALVLALLFGLAVAYWVHLSAYYKYGANVLEGGTVASGYRTWLALREYTELSSLRGHLAGPDLARTAAYGAGFAITWGLVALRTAFLRFPLHPLGFAMVAAYDVIWGPLLAVWAVKSLVLRLGGVRLYRRLVPLFVGIVLGHYITAGLIWCLLSLSGREEFLRYSVHFG